VYFASYNPYGVHVKNTGGGRPNRMYRFSTSEKRDLWVRMDLEHRQKEHAHGSAVKRCKQSAQLVGWPVDYLEE